MVVVGMTDLTGRCPSDIRDSLKEFIPRMAIEAGLIGGTGEHPG